MVVLRFKSRHLGGHTLQESRTIMTLKASQFCIHNSPEEFCCQSVCCCKLIDRYESMFIVSTIEDKVRVHPQDLAKPTLQAVTAEIERTYLDKVLPDVGLVVTIFDILDIQGGFVFPSDGAAHFDTKFRVVVFKPFVGEVLVGKLDTCNNKGLKVTLGFFDDIIVPSYHFPEDYWYQSEDRLWVWKYEGNDMWLDLQDEIRVRVKDVKFHPVPTEVELRGDGGDSIPKGTAENPFCPMEVIASTDGDGLGLTSWWSEAEAEAMAE